MREYITRSSALHAVGDIHPLDYNGQGIVERIKAIPVADVVEVTHAEWVAENSRPKSGLFYCSNCHRTCYDPQPTRAKGWTKRCRYHYCPNCGAKMDDNAIQHTECVGNALGELDEVEELSRYIDANKMADELSKVPWHDRKDEKQAVRMVKEFPAADVVERKSASWKGAGLGDYYCSLCNETYSIGAERVHDWHFCPSCGAVMDGGQDYG